MQDKTKSKQDSKKSKNPYYNYNGLFCKVILHDFREGRPIRGYVDIISENLLRIKGDFLDTTVHIDKISLITTKVNNGGSKWKQSLL